MKSKFDKVKKAWFPHDALYYYRICSDICHKNSNDIQISQIESDLKKSIALMLSGDIAVRIKENIKV